jgi:hypothetical protein
MDTRSFLRKAAVGAFLIFDTGAFSTAALAQSPVQKSGFDVNTLSTTVASTVNPARYVISASFPSGSSNSLTLTDAIPSGTQYVAGSLQAPLGATRSWSTDNGSTWVAVEPTPASSVTNLRTQNLSGTSNNFNIAVVPAPPAATISGGNTGGDGYRVIPYNNKVYTIYHHSGHPVVNKVLYCADVSTGVTCPGYPFGIPIAPNLPFDNTSTFVSQFQTALQYPEYLSRTTGELYFFAIDNMTLRPRVICANLLTGTSCGSGSYLFSNAPIVNNSTVFRELDGGVLGTRLYAMISDGSFACFDAALNARCIGTALNGTFGSGIPSSQTLSGSSQAIQINTRIYQLYHILPSGQGIACFDMAANAPCPGAFPLTSSTFGPLLPTANSAGTPDGFCVAWDSSNTNTCYDLAGVSQAKLGLSAYLTPRKPTYAIIGLYGLGTALLYQGKTYWLYDSAGPPVNGKSCWDWTTDAACVGFSTSTGDGDFYEAVADPDRQNCIWALGNKGIISSFDASTGGACSARSVITFPSSPPIASCNAPGASTAWTTINLTGLTAGPDYTSAIITIRDSTGAIVPGFNGVTVSSFPFNISSIPYGGNTTSLSISIELTGIPSIVPPAYTANPPPFVTVSWTTNDASQMCFDVAVTCSANAPLVNTVSGTLNSTNVNATHQFTSLNQGACATPTPTPTPGGPSIPTLSGWGLMTLIVFIGLASIYRLRRI